jgi:hypothetical protein
MTHYRVSYYKNLLSSDGHQFKCLQKQFDLPNVESAEKAQEIAATSSRVYTDYTV